MKLERLLYLIIGLKLLFMTLQKEKIETLKKNTWIIENLFAKK